MNNLDKAKEDLSQEWAKIREEQQQKIDSLDENLAQLNDKASALIGVDETAAEAIFADSDGLESHKKALQTEHTEVNNEWAKRMTSKRSEVYKAIRTCPSQMQAARTVFIDAAETAFATVAPAAATEDLEAINAEVKKLISEKNKLNAANSKEEKNDLDRLAAGNLKQEEIDARRALRKDASEKLEAKLLSTKQAKKAMLERSKSAAKAAPPPSHHVFKVPAVPITTAPRKAMPTFPIGPSRPPAPSAPPASLGESSISSAATAGDLTADIQRQTKKLAKQETAYMKAMLKKKSKDEYEKPHRTGIAKLQLLEVAAIIAEAFANNTFNKLGKTVQPRNGDLYIYKCGAKEPVVKLDQQQWKHDGTQKRQNKKQLANRMFFQTCYIKSILNHEDKKYILSDEENGVQLLHYRLVNFHFCIQNIGQVGYLVILYKVLEGGDRNFLIFIDYVPTKQP